MFYALRLLVQLLERIGILAPPGDQVLRLHCWHAKHINEYIPWTSQDLTIIKHTSEQVIQFVEIRCFISTIEGHQWQQIVAVFYSLALTACMFRDFNRL